MECHEVRAVLSARLDGEPVPADTDDDVVDAHLDSCPDCREWYGRAGDIGRVLRLAPVPDTPRPLVLPGLTGDDGPTGDAASAPPPASDLAGQLLAAGGVAGVGRGRALSVALSRVLLGVLALVYLAWGVVLLAGPISGAGAVPGEGAAPVGGAVANAADPGVARMAVDAATVRFAFGAGLVWAALRPRGAAGLLPVFLAMWAFGAGFATRDIVLGYIDAVTVAGLLVHLAAVGAIVWNWLARHHAVAPLRQSWRVITARPVSYSVGDVSRNSSYRPGDPGPGPDL